MSNFTKPIILVGSGNSIPYSNDKGLRSTLQHVLKNNYSVGMNYFNRYGGQTTFMTSVDWQFYLDNLSWIKNQPLVVCVDHPQLVKQKRLLNNSVALPYNTHNYWGTQSWTKGFYSNHMVSLFTMTLCVCLGFKKIFLLGCDGCGIDGKTHFYEDLIDPSQLSSVSPKLLRFRGVGKQGQNYNSSPYNNLDSLNNKWYKPFIHEDVEIFNVSMESKIDVFPKITYDEFYSMVGKNNVHQKFAIDEIKSVINNV